MTVKEQLTRKIRYGQSCPNCKHPELTRKDFKLDVFDIMTLPLGPSPDFYGPSYGPRKPEEPKAPNEFWSRVHCEQCKTSFDVSIINAESSIVYDSAMSSYEEALEAWNMSRQ